LQCSIKHGADLLGSSPLLDLEDGDDAKELEGYSHKCTLNRGMSVQTPWLGGENRKKNKVAAAKKTRWKVRTNLWLILYMHNCTIRSGRLKWYEK